MKFLRFLLPRISALALCFMVVGPMTTLPAAGRLYNTPTEDLSAAQVYMTSEEGAQVMGVLPENTPVTVLGIEGTRYRIDCYDRSGYIGRNLVEWDSQVGSYMVRCADEPEEAVSLETCSLPQLIQLRSDLLDLALAQQGTPYVYGGTSRYGFDCSGFLYYIYQALGVNLGRSACPQLAQSVIIDPADLQPGDLLFFYNTDGSDDYVTHVGMYVGGGQFIHSGSSTGVSVRELTTGYYAENFRCARRILLPGIARSAVQPSLALN